MQRLVTRGLGTDQLLVTRGLGRRTVVLQVAVEQVFRRRRGGGGRSRRREREEQDQSFTVNASMASKNNSPTIHKEGISTVSFNEKDTINVSSRHLTKKKGNQISINASVHLQEKKTEVPIVINVSSSVVRKEIISEITASAIFTKRKLVKESVCNGAIKKIDTVQVKASFASKAIN